jgi:hypothetical protein
LKDDYTADGSDSRWNEYDYSDEYNDSDPSNKDNGAMNSIGKYKWNKIVSLLTKYLIFSYLDIYIKNLSTIVGVFEFEKRTESVVSNVGVIDIQVLRKTGNSGAVTVTIQAFEDTATQTLDFTLDDTSVEFADGEVYYSFRKEYIH